jgi:cytochrome P450
MQRISLTLSTTPSKTPPGPKHRFLGANASLLFYSDIARYLEKMWKKYGDFVHLRASGHSMYLINNIHHIEQILVKDHRNFTKGTGFQRARILLGNGLITSDGDFHDTQRKMINPAFHRSMIKGYSETVSRCTKKMLDRWEKMIEVNPVIDIEKEMTKLFIAIIMDALFAEDSSEELIDTCCEYSEVFHSANPLMQLSPETALKLPLPSVKRFMRVKDTLESMLWSIMKKRKSEDIREKFDILSMIMKSENPHGGTMSDEELFDELRTLFVAANDTSSKVMTWAVYSLSQNGTILQTVESQIEQVLGSRSPEFEDVEHLPYVKMVMNETMRLYPPVWMMPRTPIEDFTLGDYSIKKGSSLFITPFFVHRDERYYPDPDTFDPERWTDEERRKRPKMSFFPFGAGPRVCVGEAFSMYHLVVIMAAICQRYEFRLVPGQKVDIVARITLKPSHGMNMILKRKQ